MATTQGTNAMTDEPTAKQVKALIEASESLAAFFAADACRVIEEWPDDANIVPYLNKIPVKVVREFDQAIYSITEGMAQSVDEEVQQREKYDQAMAKMNGTNQ